MPKPKSSRRKAPPPRPEPSLAHRVGNWIVRGVSAAAGSAALYHEVYSGQEARWPVIFLGMWLIGMPPALWLDSLRTVGRLAEVVQEARPVLKETNAYGDDE
jgi:hypothetical protein